jgi:hypothetical protein
MQFAPEVLFAAALAVVAFLAGLVYLRLRGKRTRSVGLRIANGPANLRFTCAGCSGQFTHSRRTIAAWNKGTRKFFCNACHTKWHGVLPTRRAPVITKPDRASKSPPPVAPPPADRKSRAGCLGVAVLLVTIPAGLVVVASRYI